MPIQSVPAAKLTSDEFLNWYPDNSSVKYELHDSKIVELPRGSGDRAKIDRNIRGKLSREITLLDLPYSIPDRCLLKILGKDTVYQPDIVVLELSALSNESRWQESSVILNPSSVRLVVELFDEHSEKNYPNKWWDYEDMGLSEYWAADYQHKPNLQSYRRDGLPCLVVCFPSAEYPVNSFAGDEAIESVAFPYLKSTANQLFKRL